MAKPNWRSCDQKYGVRELSIFGSAARGEMRSESDIDLLVEFLPGAGADLVDYAALMLDLSRLIGRKVDLVSRKGLKPLIRASVLKEARLLYADAAHERKTAHELLDRLAPSQVAAVRGLLEAMLGPVARRLRTRRRTASLLPKRTGAESATAKLGSHSAAATMEEVLAEFGLS